jgi:uncharacterized OB-fold protein
MRRARVYAATVVHVAPEYFAAQAPYQIALVDTNDDRILVRIVGERVAPGDIVSEQSAENAMLVFRKE